MVASNIQFSLLRCPNCESDTESLSFNNNALVCLICASNFPISRNRPVLLQDNNDLFKLTDYNNIENKSKKSTLIANLSKFIPDPSVNLSRKRELAKLGELLDVKGKISVLVVGSGTQRQILTKMLNLTNKLDLICTDIDVNADVDYFCDGHRLPFKSNYFDAVITTVVLEHVMYPEQVVNEIHRVLKVDGYIYSEVPFMQQVHEGAYDFTRYSLSGHRRLFNGFKEISSGMVAGPSTTLAWSIENFFLAFVSQPLIRLFLKGVIRLMFAWIKYLDIFLEKQPAAMDGASCTYFLGSKSNFKLNDHEIIANYVGAKHLSHT